MKVCAQFFFFLFLLKVHITQNQFIRLEFLASISPPYSPPSYLSLHPPFPSSLLSLFFPLLGHTLQDLYSQSTTKFFLKEIFFSCNEDVLAQPLSQVQADFPNVQVGSYPDTNPR